MIIKSFPLAGLLLLAFSTSLIAQSHSINSPLAQYVQQASELSGRARANVYFPNPQSVFNGVQISFVNVGKGNLTFLRRDIVASGHIPIVFARVYDSGGAGSIDFGPGWRLSAAETISIVDGKARLSSENGSVIVFVNNGDAKFRLEKEHPSDYAGLTQTAKDSIRATLRTGFSKEFKLIGELFRLVKVTDRNGNVLRLTYDKDELAKVESEHHFIVIARNEKGRITKAEDDQGRKVQYSYDEQSYLIEADDLGGHAWKYMYTENGKLKNAEDPLQRLNFGAAFDDAGRVRRMHLPSGVIQFSYDATNRSTTVIDRKRLISRFFQNEDGITTRVVNALGEESAIVLDENRNVMALSRNGSVIEQMEYDQQHRLLVRHSSSGSAPLDVNYSYDASTGLLSGIHSGSGQDQSFVYDGHGNLLGANLADGTHKYAYSLTGDLITLSVGDATLAFSHDPDGLIASVSLDKSPATEMKYRAGSELSEATFSGGTTASYRYQPSGLRAGLVFNNGSRSEYSYDPAGNLTGSKIFDTKGKQIDGQSLEMDGSYQLVRWTLSSGTETTYRYDPNGNLTEIKKGKSITKVEYDSLNRLTAVVTSEGRRLTYSYGPGERSLIEQYHHGNILVEDLRDTGFTFSSPVQVNATRPVSGILGSVRFAETLGTFQLSNADGSEIIRPQGNLEAALKKLFLFDSSVPAKALRSGFNIPFNTMFMPAEYLTINCCPECYYDGGEEGWYCPPCFIPLAPPPPNDFTLTNQQTITDGNQGSLAVTVTSGTAISYQWSFSAPQGAGNSPNVNFSSPTAAQTSTDGHWYALPNATCPTADQPGAPARVAPYQITATVGFADGDTPVSHATTLSINFIWFFTGSTGQADITGNPAMAGDAQGVWRITGVGEMTRVPPANGVLVPPSSQFFNKSQQHEQVHVDQWNPGRLVGDLYIPSVLLSRVANLTGTSQTDLQSQFDKAKADYFTEEINLFVQRKPALEHEAYLTSDAIAPQYMIQNCGRF